MSVNAIMAQTFPPGVTIRNTDVRKHEIQVFDPQARQLRLRCDTWPVYKVGTKRNDSKKFNPRIN